MANREMKDYLRNLGMIATSPSRFRWLQPSRYFRYVVTPQILKMWGIA